MKRFTLLIALVIIFCFSTFAQTKRIAHRSHSGNHSNYSMFETSDNLGNIDPEYLYRKTAELDSFFKVQDSLRIKDSIYRVKRTDSLKRLYAPKNDKPKPHKDSLLKKQKEEPIKIEVKPTPKQQSVPLPLLLLIAIPTLAIVFATKCSKY